MSTSGDWLPRPRAAQIEMARRWKPLVAVQQTAWNIAPADVARLDAAILSVDAAQASFDNSATPGNRAALREAFRGLAAAMRWFKRRVFLTPPLDSRDYADLGLRPPDTTRTPHTTVTERVAATIGPGGVREVVVRFWIEGAAHRAKPRGYDGAVLIWAVGGAPFTRLEDLRDGNLMASRTPHTLVFTDDQRGKTVSMALAWQNERGIRGEWGEILSTIIP
jgi:hypothetical protein